MSERETFAFVPEVDWLKAEFQTTADRQRQGYVVKFTVPWRLAIARIAAPSDTPTVEIS